MALEIGGEVDAAGGVIAFDGFVEGKPGDSGGFVAEIHSGKVAFSGFFDEEAFVVMIEAGGGFFVTCGGLGDEVVFVCFA